MKLAEWTQRYYNSDAEGSDLANPFQDHSCHWEEKTKVYSLKLAEEVLFFAPGVWKIVGNWVT